MSQQSQKGGAAVKSRPVASGRDLIPKVAAASSVSTRTYKYWIGALPSCPFSTLIVGGIDFPKVNEDLVTSADGTAKNRVPHLGRIAELTEDQYSRLIERLPHAMLRFKDGRRDNEPGVGSTLDDMSYHPRRADKIRIPREDEIELRPGHRQLRKYQPHPNDEPAADYIYAIPCEDQERPVCGTLVPEPLSTTGIKFPS